MTHGIDWDAIERARLAKDPEKPLPDGWFRAQDYGARFGIAKDTAYFRLTRMYRRGAIRREKMGAEFAYSLVL